jgi:hypothetical protein
VLKTLDCWPALPIVVEYGGYPALSPPAPEDEDNIVAALRRSDRVRSIHLTVTMSLLTKLYSIVAPFTNLEDLVILSLDDVGVTFPNAFRWGPHLRTLHLTGIALPPLPPLLSSSKDLVDLQLHEIPYISPESLWNTWSGMTQLRLLSLRFDSLHYLTLADSFGIYSPPKKRVVLPTLTCFKYRGTSECLDRLVAGFDAPYLENIEIISSDILIYYATRLRGFIDRIETQKSHRQADILLSERSVSISVTQPLPSCLKLQVICEPSNQQLFPISRFLFFFSAFFLCLEDLRIEATGLSSRRDGLNRWLEVIRTFRSMKRVHLAGDFSTLSTDFAHALQISQVRPEAVLPALRNLYISQPGPRHEPLRIAVVSFMVFRRLSGYPIEVEYEQLRTNGPRDIGMTYAQRQHHTLTCLE